MGFPALKPHDDKEHPRGDPTPSVQWHPEVRRSYPRYDVQWQVAMQAEGSSETIRGLAVNISRGGCLVRTADELNPDRRHLIVFLPRGDATLLTGPTCPHCGAGGIRLRPRSAWARVLRQGRGGGGWASAMEFESLLELGEDQEAEEPAR
ncbi:MAG: hypothetical protein GKS06_13155 [Acidobacteria bacterium]|nr:hypothetical protein [Acidobacteriota bacterium]